MSVMRVGDVVLAGGKPAERERDDDAPDALKRMADVEAQPAGDVVDDGLGGIEGDRIGDFGDERIGAEDGLALRGIREGDVEAREPVVSFVRSTSRTPWIHTAVLSPLPWLQGPEVGGTVMSRCFGPSASVSGRASSGANLWASAQLGTSRAATRGARVAATGRARIRSDERELDAPAGLAAAGVALDHETSNSPARSLGRSRVS